jgi:hypothetical protein
VRAVVIVLLCLMIIPVSLSAPGGRARVEGFDRDVIHHGPWDEGF